MKKKILVILVFMLFLISACVNGASCKNISKAEKSVSANSNQPENSYYRRFADIYISFSTENAITTINNEPLDGSTYKADKEWLSTLEIDYFCASDRYKFDVYICYQADADGIVFFDKTLEFEYIGTDCPDDIYKEVTKTIPKGNYLFHIFAFVRVGVYWKNDDGYWEYIKTVEDNELCNGDMKVPKNKAHNNTPLLNILENFPILYQLLQRFSRF